MAVPFPEGFIDQPLVSRALRVCAAMNRSGAGGQASQGAWGGQDSGDWGLSASSQDWLSQSQSLLGRSLAAPQGSGQARQPNRSLQQQYLHQQQQQQQQHQLHETMYSLQQQQHQLQQQQLAVQQQQVNVGTGSFVASSHHQQHLATSLPSAQMFPTQNPRLSQGHVSSLASSQPFLSGSQPPPSSGTMSGHLLFPSNTPSSQCQGPEEGPLGACSQSSLQLPPSDPSSMGCSSFPSAQKTSRQPMQAPLSAFPPTPSATPLEGSMGGSASEGGGAAASDAAAEGDIARDIRLSLLTVLSVLRALPQRLQQLLQEMSAVKHASEPELKRLLGDLSSHLEHLIRAMQSQFEKLRDTATSASQQCSSGVSSLQQSLSTLLQRLEQPWPCTEDLSQLRKVLRQDTRRVVNIIKTVLALVREVLGAVCGSDEANSGLLQHLRAAVRHEMATVLSAVSIVQADCNTNTSLLQNIAGDVIQVKEELTRLRAAVESLPARMAPLLHQASIDVKTEPHLNRSVRNALPPLQQRGRSLQSPVAEVRPSPRLPRAVLRRTTTATPLWKDGAHLPQGQATVTGVTSFGHSAISFAGNACKRPSEPLAGATLEGAVDDAQSRSGVSDTTTPTLPVQDLLSRKSLIDTGADDQLGSTHKNLSDRAAQRERFSVEPVPVSCSGDACFQSTGNYTRHSTGNIHTSKKENDALVRCLDEKDSENIRIVDRSVGQDPQRRYHNSVENVRHDAGQGASSEPAIGCNSDMKPSSEFSPDWLVVQRTEIKECVVQKISTANEYRQANTESNTRKSGPDLGNRIRDDGRFSNATTARATTVSFNNIDEELEIVEVPNSANVPRLAALHQTTSLPGAVTRMKQQKVSRSLQTTSPNKAVGSERTFSSANAVGIKGTSRFSKTLVETSSKFTAGACLQAEQRVGERINKTPLATTVAGPTEMGLSLNLSPSSSINCSDTGSPHFLQRNRQKQQRKFFRYSHSRCLTFSHATGNYVPSTQGRDGGYLLSSTSERAHNTISSHTAHVEQAKGSTTGSGNKENAGQLNTSSEHRQEFTTPRQERGYVLPSRPAKKCVSVDEFVQQVSVGTPKHWLHFRRPVTTPLRLDRETPLGVGQGGRRGHDGGRPQESEGAQSGDRV